MPDPRLDSVVRYAPFAEFLVQSAQGSWLTTTDGRRVLDFTSGQMCATVGHSHPSVTAAIQASAESLIHLNSMILSDPVLALTARIAELAPDPLARVLPLSTGAEANEAAIRMAKLASGRFELVGLTRAWHGLQAGVAALNLAGGHAGYGPHVPGALTLPAPYAYRCPIRHCDGSCDCTCLEVGFDLVDQQSAGSLCAALVEPVLSAGGVIVPPPGYFTLLTAKLHERGMLLIADEAQTAFGRLGHLFGLDAWGVVPDVLVLSKTLGGGLPLAATVVTDELEARCVERGFLHVTSHLADPLPAAAGLAMLDVVSDEGLVEQARRRGDRLRAGLDALADRHEQIGDVRGMGLLQGVEFVLDRDAKTPAAELGSAVARECLRCGLSVNITGRTEQAALSASCFRIAPPLTVSDEEIDLGLDILDQALTGVLARDASLAAGRPSAG